ncbi:uncharacterized protein LOC121401616 isoform X4 [Xenopus laevis]|uniref:Uncharacterized protein LOC121401616 isoform X4 n=1 Tax=Xenopus laevis TaxID=8355 RepID=A0A8J1MMS6_XENLA|nr:uncharacterized protein LOC121401616 isoform X4 [Xenopus laevis]
MRQENRETGNKKLIYCHKMNRGKCQGHADDNIYQNVGDCKKEPTENPGKKKKEIHQDPRQESKYLKATERLRAQRTLLIAMMILHILTLILLILFSSFLVTYSSDIFGQLNKTGKEKTDPAPLIIAINVTFDNSNSVCSDVTLENCNCMQCVCNTKKNYCSCLTEKKIAVRACSCLCFGSPATVPSKGLPQDLPV